MGELIIKKWQCDRCKRVEDAKPKRTGYGAWYEIRISVDYETAGGTEIEWREMCPPCNKAVASEISAMKDSARAARKEPT